MTALKGEIEKICAFSGAEHIHRSDIDAVVEPVLDAVVFQMTDLLSEGRYSAALEKLEMLLKMQQEPVVILGAIGGHFRRLATAKTLKEDILEGFKIGADDYITKPFVPVEVLARVRSQLRRYALLGSQIAQQPGTLIIGGVELDDRTKSVTVDGEQVALTPTEYAILHLLMQNPGKVFSTKSLYESVWQEAALGSEGAVAVHIRHLREKIEINPSEPRYLKVVWGQGYKLEGGSR